MIKNGTRLQSQVCDTQVIVVAAADSLDDLRAGGVPMVPIGDEKSTDATLDPAFSDGNLMGKRYVDETGAEVLVTKAGKGTLSVGIDGADHQGSQAAASQRLARPRASRVSPLGSRWPASSDNRRVLRLPHLRHRGRSRLPEVVLPASRRRRPGYCCRSRLRRRILRPTLGGIVFGHFGDRIGRKRMLVYSLVGMGIRPF